MFGKFQIFLLMLFSTNYFLHCKGGRNDNSNLLNDGSKKSYSPVIPSFTKLFTKVKNNLFPSNNHKGEYEVFGENYRNGVFINDGLTNSNPDKSDAKRKKILEKLSKSSASSSSTPTFNKSSSRNSEGDLLHSSHPTNQIRKNDSQSLSLRFPQNHRNLGYGSFPFENNYSSHKHTAETYPVFGSPEYSNSDNLVGDINVINGNPKPRNAAPHNNSGIEDVGNPPNSPENLIRFDD